MMPMGKKKKPAPFEDLLGGEGPMAEESEFEEDEYSEDAGFDDVTEPMDDPLAAAGDDMGGDLGMGLDPEQAQLAETLGFTEPEQQQALISLIKLVAAPAPSPVGEF